MMSLLKELREAQILTEREVNLRDYLLNHPETVHCMSCRQLGEATYTSAATVTRFCRKFGYDGWPDFKLRFVSDLKAGQEINDGKSIQISERDNS